MLYRLLCLKDPQSYYRLTKSSTIGLAFLNVSVDQAYGVGYTKLQQFLLNSPWFREHGEVRGVKEEHYVPSKDIGINVGSKASHFIGLDIFATCMKGDTEVLVKFPDRLETVIMTMEDLYNLDISFQVVGISKYGGVIPSDNCKCYQTKTASEYIRLELENGSILECTIDHMFLLKSGEYKKAIDLTPDDELYFFEESECDEKEKERELNDKLSHTITI